MIAPPSPFGLRRRRKVELPQGGAPGNTRSGQLEGKWLKTYRSADAPQGWQ